MKNILLLAFNLFFMNISLFGQGKIAQIIYESYNADSAVWTTNHRENWMYDENNREVLYTTWDIYQGVFAPYNNTRLETFYHPNGQLALQKKRSWGDTIWMTNQTEFQYSNENELINIFHKNEHSESNIISYQRTGFIQDLSADKRTAQFYFTTENPDNWTVQHQRDSFFDANGCLSKTTIINFNESGELINERWTTKDFNENCQIQQSGYWLRDSEADSMYMSSRHLYTYTNNGKTQSDVYERLNRHFNEWETEHLVEKTWDEDNREIRYFYENYNLNYTDTLLKLRTYTEKGELATYRELKTAHGLNDNPLYLVRFDSLIYQYDDEERLIKKTQFIQHYNNLPRKLTVRYDYYCNGQLKTETFEELPSVSKIHYEYYGNTDCNLLKTEKPTLLVFPNPSDGNFIVKSNLLPTSDATIELFSVTGQLVFFQKVNRVAENYSLAIPNLAKGQYILTIQNKKEILSKKIIIR